MVKKLIILILVILLCLGVYGCSESTEVSIVEPIIDVTQFFRISPEKLIEVMGKPKEINEWNYNSANGNTYAATSYYYDNTLGKCEFLIIDNKVVRLNIIKEMQFKNEKDILRMFGITITDNIKKVADTGYALRYSPVSDKVAEVCISNINGKKFDDIKITYDLRYFN